MTKLPTLGILFLTAVRAVIVAKLVILSITRNLEKYQKSLLTSFILASRVILVAELVISGILSSIILILAIFQQHHFLLQHLAYLNQRKQVLIYCHLIYLLYFSNCLN